MYIDRVEKRWTDKHLCEGLQRLWREVFGDTDEYISLLFGEVYRQSMTRWRYVSGDVSEDVSGGASEDEAEGRRLMAMLFATPYRFCVRNAGSVSKDRYLSGIYLSGLATAVPYRRCGVMGELIRECVNDCVSGRIERAGRKETAIERIGREELCAPALHPSPDFIFLIPADNHLRQYYERFGFRSVGARFVAGVQEVCVRKSEAGMWRVVELATLNHTDREVIHAYISQYENRGVEEGCLQILHSRGAIDVALAESAQNNGRIVIWRNRQTPSDNGMEPCDGHTAWREGFLWAESAPEGGWRSKVWHAVSISQLQSMIQGFRDNIACCDTAGQCFGAIPAESREITLYGAPWQWEIMEQMHRQGLCTAPENELYGMVLPLKETEIHSLLSIDMMLD